MDLSTLDWLLLAAFLFYGVLCLFDVYRLGREDKLFNSMVLYPGAVRKEDCLDPKAFMAFMRPVLTVVGIGCTLVALLYFVRLRLGLPKLAAVAHMVLAVATLAYGFWMYRRAAKRFW